MLDASQRALRQVASMGYDDASYPSARLARRRSAIRSCSSALSMLPVCHIGGTGASGMRIVRRDPVPAAARSRSAAFHGGRWTPAVGCAKGPLAVPRSRAVAGAADVERAGALAVRCRRARDRVRRRSLDRSLMHGARARRPGSLAHRRHRGASRAARSSSTSSASVLTSIVNSLPDPIVIINASTRSSCRISRAEHLLSMDGGGFGRTPARGRDQQSSLHLASLARPRSTRRRRGRSSRELNMVDPDEGPTCCSRCSRSRSTSAYRRRRVSVLRDVTDLRRAAGELERQVQRVRLAEFEPSASATVSISSSRTSPIRFSSPTTGRTSSS